MPRRPRVLLADYPLHIVQRGINREPCFFTDEDYHCYLHIKKGQTMVSRVEGTKMVVSFEPLWAIRHWKPLMLGVQDNEAALACIGRRFRSRSWQAQGEKRKYGQEEQAGSTASDHCHAEKLIQTQGKFSSDMP